jgi:hypothetical protein
MILSRTTLTAILFALSTMPRTSLAEDTRTIGGVTVSADCALARKERPRLLFTKADLPRLRARLEHPRIAAELEHAKQLAANDKAGAILLGVLYYLTDESKYIEAAKSKLEPSWVQTYPLAADLVMGAMTPAQQQAEADRIVEIVRKEHWRPHVVLDLAAWGHGHDDFLDADLKTRLGQWWTDEVISTISMGWGTSALGQGGVWGKLLRYDPELSQVEPRMLPPARLFPENGHVVMRSDWTEDATYALFRCGRYGEIDGWWGRNNADNHALHQRETRNPCRRHGRGPLTEQRRLEVRRLAGSQRWLASHAGRRPTRPPRAWFPWKGSSETVRSVPKSRWERQLTRSLSQPLDQREGTSVLRRPARSCWTAPWRPKSRTTTRSGPKIHATKRG